MEVLVKGTALNKYFLWSKEPHHAKYLKTPVTYFTETHTVTLESIALAMCHGPRLKLKTRAALRPWDVLFGCQKSTLTHKHAVLGT